MKLAFQCHHNYSDGFVLDANFQLAQTMTVITGPSGSGKTTILMALAGLLADTARQQIRLDDLVLADSEAGIFVPPHRRAMGIAFQNQRLFPHLTAGQNLRYGLKRRDGQSAISPEKVEERLGIAGFESRRVGSLSGGQQQRVALGRAIVGARKLMLLDEPLAHVELELRANLAEFLVDFVRQSGIPAIVVTHDEDLAGRLGGGRLVIDRGYVGS